MKEKNILENKLIIFLIALLSSVLWGSAFPTLKISFAELNLLNDDIWSKVLFAGFRFLGSSILLFIFLFFRKEKMNVKFSSLYKVLILGLLQTTLQYFFFYNGLANTSGMKAAILQSSSTFFVVLLAHFIYHNDKINNRKILGLITGFLGIIITNWGSGFNVEFTFYGEGFLLIAGFVASFGTILAKHLTIKINPFLITAIQMFFGSIILIIIGASQVGLFSLKFNVLSFSLLLYSSFLSAVAFSLWYSLLKYNKAGEVTIYRFMIPVSGSILSSIFISDESLSINIFFALIMVAIGIISVNYKKNYKKEIS
ncbi:MAG: DMT family transporter [Thermotogota bacterium]